MINNENIYEEGLHTPQNSIETSRLLECIHVKNYAKYLSIFYAMFKDTNQYTAKIYCLKKGRHLRLLLIGIYQGEVGINCLLLAWNNLLYSTGRNEIQLRNLASLAPPVNRLLITYPGAHFAKVAKIGTAVKGNEKGVHWQIFSHVW